MTFKVSMQNLNKVILRVSISVGLIMAYCLFSFHFKIESIISTILCISIMIGIGYYRFFKPLKSEFIELSDHDVKIGGKNSIAFNDIKTLTVNKYKSNVFSMFFTTAKNRVGIPSYYDNDLIFIEIKKRLPNILVIEKKAPFLLTSLFGFAGFSLLMVFLFSLMRYFVFIKFGKYSTVLLLIFFMILLTINKRRTISKNQ